MQNKISADNGENKGMWEITLSIIQLLSIIDSMMQQLLKQAVVRNDACTPNSLEQSLKIKTKCHIMGPRKGKSKILEIFYQCNNKQENAGEEVNSRLYSNFNQISHCGKMRLTKHYK